MTFVVLTKKRLLILFSCVLIGAAAFTLGMCMYFGVAEFGKYANLIFGLILILYGVYMLVITFARKK